MQTFLELVKDAVSSGADELYIIAGQPVMFKTGTSYSKADDTVITPEITARFINQAYDIAKRPTELLENNRDDQFALSLPGISRVRVMTYFQRNSRAITARIIPFSIPEPETVHIPKEITAMAELRDGLIMFCGPSGCGKSTSAACLIDAINRTRTCHILTLESPVEFLFRNQSSFISQRELGLDTADIDSGLRFSRRVSPEVLYIGDLDCGKAFSDVITEVENGTLVIGTLNAVNPATAITSVLDRFGNEERLRVAQAFSRTLSALIFETLVQTGEGRHPVFRIIRPDESLRAAICSADSDGIRRLLADR